MSRRDVIDVLGVTLLGVLLIGLLYCAAVAVREDVAAESARPE